MDILILSIIVVSALIFFLSFLQYRIGLSAITASVLFIFIGLVFLNAFPLTMLGCGLTGGNSTTVFSYQANESRSSFLMDNAEVIVGTITSGDVSDTFSRNNVFFNVREESATPGFDLIFNASHGELEDNHTIEWFGRYVDGANDNMTLSIFNFTANDWLEIETILPSTTNSMHDLIIGPLFDFSQNSTVRLRFLNNDTGNPSNSIFIDELLGFHMETILDLTNPLNQTTTNVCTAQTLELNTNEQTYIGWAFVMLGLATLYALILEAYNKKD